MAVTARPPTAHRPAAVATVLCGVLVVLASTRLRRVEVRGPSMRPTLEPGDRLVVVRCPPAVGRLVVATLPTTGRLAVKRVAAIDPVTGAVDLRGDNAGASTDSRHLGLVAADAVLGRPVHRYAPAEAAGWVWTA